MNKLIFICFLAISSNLFSQGNGNGDSFTVTVNNGNMVNITIPINDITEAGNDYYNKDYENDLGSQTEISISSTFQNQLFTVTINRGDDDPAWPLGFPDLDLQMKVSSSSSLISPAYQPFKSIPYNNGGLSQFSFDIGGNKKNQMIFNYKIKGISVLLPVNTYKTTIFFTVMM